MAKRRSETSRLIEFFMRSPLDEAKQALETAREIVRQRDPQQMTAKKRQPKQASAAGKASKAMAAYSSATDEGRNEQS